MNSRSKTRKKNEQLSTENTSGSVLVPALFNRFTTCLGKGRKFHNVRLFGIVRIGDICEQFRGREMTEQLYHKMADK